MATTYTLGNFLLAKYGDKGNTSEKVQLMSVLSKIPTVLTVAVLVGIFAGLKRHEKTARVQWWMVAWFFVFVHFAVQLLEPEAGAVSPWLLALDFASLQASAVAFCVSVSAVAEDRAKSLILVLVAGLPSVAYAVLAAYDIHQRWPFILCLLATYGGGIAFLLFVRRSLTHYVGVIAGIGVALAVWSLRAAWRGSFDEGMTGLLGFAFALPGVFLCWNYWRKSPGILATAGGFFFWGAVFPVGMLTDRFAPTLNIPAELWNVPKLFVAFGMILIVVEDKSLSIEGMQRKERAANRQLERFSAITSQLLSGVPVDSLCAEIASTISQVSSYRVAAIALDDGLYGLRIAGVSGLSESCRIALEAEAQKHSVKDIESFCVSAVGMGDNSFQIAPASDADGTPDQPTRVRLFRDAGNQLIIPLRSARGSCLGCIALNEPANPDFIDPVELSRIELLANDLAVAMELRSLTQQLVRSEKLAALGQLVAGVAHELNNPLTAVMGYGELLSDEVPANSSAQERITRLVGEGRRMKRIVDNLLRFARQSTPENNAADLNSVIADVLALREYYVHTRNLSIEVDIEPSLPKLMIDEGQLKQVLLNLLNNSIDAIEGSRESKQIRMRAFCENGHAVIEVEDSGDGFADLNRAMDPFYTTKPVGKGTGLGLSICYGIIKEHRGEIRLENLDPIGSRVSIDLPFANTEIPLLSLTAARA